MALTTRSLTPLQTAFVEAMVVDGLKPQDAAHQAGYAESKSNAYRNLKLPHVQEYLSKRIAAEFGVSAAAAVYQMKSLSNSARSEHVRMEASKDLLDRAGFKPIDRTQVQVAGDVRVSIDLG